MELHPLNIRQAERDDLASLLDLYQQLNPNDERPSTNSANYIFKRFAAYEGSTILMGEVDGALIASCTLIVVPNLTRGGSRYGLIENVVTHCDFRKRGYGRRMLLTASDKAWESGCYKVMLMTGSKNPETLDFYLSAGF